MTDDGIEPTLQYGGGCTEECAEEDGDGGCAEGDAERRASAVEESGQDITANAVDADPVRPRWRCEREAAIKLFGGAVRGDSTCQDGGENHCGEHYGTDQEE